MSDRPINNSGYTAEARAIDVALNIRLSEIRQQQDAGEITVQQAADLRVAALSEHLSSLRSLRARHFGNGDDE